MEGSQQLALSRYVQRNALRVRQHIDQLCKVEHLDGKALSSSLLTFLKKFKLEGSLTTDDYDSTVKNAIYRIGNSTGICSPAKSKTYGWYALANEGSWPQDFMDVNYGISNGIFTGLGQKIPVEKLEISSPLEIALKAWKIVYLYYWSCFIVIITCSILFLVLIKRHKTDMFDYASIISRCVALIVAGAMMALYAEKTVLYGALKSPMLLPICVILLFLILVVDKVTSIWCNTSLQKSGEPYVLEEGDEHGHEGGHGGDHEVVHRGPVSNGPVGGLAHVAKQSRWSSHGKMLPLGSVDLGRAHHPPAADNRGYASVPFI